MTGGNMLVGHRHHDLDDHHRHHDHDDDHCHHDDDDHHRHHDLDDDHCHRDEDDDDDAQAGSYGSVFSRDSRGNQPHFSLTQVSSSKEYFFLLLQF